MKIRSLNNATTLVSIDKHSILIDPWLVGDIYKGSWSPYSKTKDLNFLNDVNIVFISHIHEDHWDLKTLELLNRKTTIYLPKMKVNKVIESKLKSIGFKNIVFLELSKKYKLFDLFEFTVVPPLNAFGQEIGKYDKNYEIDATCIDTGLLITDTITSSSHLFLCDNTPYDINLLNDIVENDLTTLWYPYNSYAQDYPICYDLSHKEKLKIHDEIEVKRSLKIKDAIKVLNPKYYFPHSSDFVLNGPKRKSFYNYIQKKFMDRPSACKLYAFARDANNNSISEYVGAGDQIIINSNCEIEITRNKYGWEKVTPSDKLEKLESKMTNDIWDKLHSAFDSMNDRLKSFNISIKDASQWILNLQTPSKTISYSFSKMKIIQNDMITSKDKQLTIILSDQQLAALLNRELHWNNAMIGCHLNYKRIPNEYCKDVYKSLNFLHL